MLIFLSDARSGFPLLFDPSLWRQGSKHFSQLLQVKICGHRVHSVKFRSFSKFSFVAVSLSPAQLWPGIILLRAQSLASFPASCSQRFLPPLEFSSGVACLIPVAAARSLRARTALLRQIPCCCLCFVAGFPCSRSPGQFCPPRSWVARPPVLIFPADSVLQLFSCRVEWASRHRVTCSQQSIGSAPAEFLRLCFSVAAFNPLLQSKVLLKRNGFPITCGCLQVKDGIILESSDQKTQRFSSSNYTPVAISWTRPPGVWWNDCEDINRSSIWFLSSVSL
jgi:hypothetical protein